MRSSALPHHVPGPRHSPSRHHQEPAPLLKTKTIQIGDLSIFVTRKAIKNVHLSVHPAQWPRDARRTFFYPPRCCPVSRHNWIRKQQQKLISQVREAPRKFIDRESHYVWGRRHLLTIVLSKC